MIPQLLAWLFLASMLLLPALCMPPLFTVGCPSACTAMTDTVSLTSAGIVGKAGICSCATCSDYNKTLVAPRLPPGNPCQYTVTDSTTSSCFGFTLSLSVLFAASGGRTVLSGFINASSDPVLCQGACSRNFNTNDLGAAAIDCTTVGTVILNSEFSRSDVGCDCSAATLTAVF